MSLSRDPPSDSPAVSELLHEALALPANELDAWFASLQGGQLAHKDELQTLMALRTFSTDRNRIRFRAYIGRLTQQAQ